MSRRLRTSLAGLGLLLVTVAVSACDANDDGSGGAGGASGEESGTGGTGAAELPEAELEESFLAPVVLGKTLFTANPDTNRIAAIDASSLSIVTYPAGNRPEAIAVLPATESEGGALVINQLSDDVTALMKSGSTFSNTRIPVHPEANAWAVSPAGGYAIAWSRADATASEFDGFQDLTVLDAAQDLRPTRLSVGFRPIEVHLDAAETRAFVVSDPGISVIVLDQGDPFVQAEYFLPVDSGKRDVEFTPDGQYALVRVDGSSEILVVRLEDDAREIVSLPKVVTDLDIEPGGTYAWAVLRADGTSETGIGGASGTSGVAESLVARLPLATLFSDPTDYDVGAVDGVVGSISLSASGKMAALYSTSLDSQLVFAFDRESFESRAIDVKGKVRAVLVDETGDFAVAILVPSGSTKLGAFALLPLSEELPARIEGTDADVSAVALDPLGRGALVATDGGTSEVSSVYFASFPNLFVDKIDLASRPLSVGVVPEAGKAFVSQEHAEGRITFVELQTGKKKTITGYELESKVVN